MKALLIGSISVLADTSEMQRNAFNDAFHDAGLDWYWSRDDYRKMLKDSGGQDRIAAFSEVTGERVNAAARPRFPSRCCGKADTKCVCTRRRRWMKPAVRV